MQWVSDPSPSPGPTEGTGGTTIVTVCALDGPVAGKEVRGLEMKHGGLIYAESIERKYMVFYILL